jgi:hypothetical protein
MINSHPNAKRIEGRHVLDRDGTVEYEIVIVTDLALHALDPSHDADKVRDLLKWAHQFISTAGVASRVILMEQPES